MGEEESGPDGTTGKAGGRSWLDGDPQRTDSAMECCGTLHDTGCLSLMTLMGVVCGLLSAISGTGPASGRLRRETAAPSGPFAAALFRGVRYYQLHISARRPGYGSCRYAPTCSAYAAESLRRHGALKGMRLAARRLRRCRPGTAGGVDLVP